LRITAFSAAADLALGARLFADSWGMPVSVANGALGKRIFNTLRDSPSP
jgi:hypothetical protein